MVRADRGDGRTRGLRAHVPEHVQPPLCRGGVRDPDAGRDARRHVRPVREGLVRACARPARGPRQLRSRRAQLGQLHGRHRERAAGRRVDGLRRSDGLRADQRGVL